MGLLPKQYEIVKATVDFLSGVAELAVFMRATQQRNSVEFYFGRLRDFEKNHYLQTLEVKLKEAYEVFYRFEVLKTEEFPQGAGSFMGISDKEIMNDL